MQQLAPASHRASGLRGYAFLTPLIMALCFVAVGLGLWSLHYVEDRLVHSSGETLAVISADIADKLEKSLYARFADVQMLAKADDIRRRDPQASTAYLTEMQQLSPAYLWLAVTDGRGKIIAATNPASIGQDRSQHEWFKTVRASGKVHVDDAQISYDSGGKRAVAFTAPITNAQSEFMGVVTTRVELDSLEDVFKQTVRALRVQRNNPVRIEWQFLSRSGDVIVDSVLREEGHVNLKEMGLPSALLTASAEPGYIEEMHLRRRVPVVTGYAQTEQHADFFGLHWGVLVRMDRSDILAPIRAVLVKLAAAGLAILLPLLGFLVWTTKRLRQEWVQAQEETARATTAEEMVRRSEESTRLIIDSALDAVVTIDAEGIVKSWNPQAESTFGWPSREAIGQKLSALIIPEEQREAHERGLVRFLQTGAGPILNTRIEVSARHRDGREFPVELAVVPLRLRGAVIFNAFIRDLTERKRIEEELRQSEKLAALGTLIDGVSHELNNPLFMISGFTQLAQETFRLGQYEKVLQNLESIGMAAQQMAAIIGRFVSVVSTGPGDIHSCDINAVLNETLWLMKNDFLTHQIKVTGDLDKNLSAVYANPQQLAQVFLNVFANAREALCSREQDRRIAVKTATAEPNIVEIRISDNGPGISQETCRPIFEPTYTTRLGGKGVGLGLSICHRIISGLNGTIQAESSVGEGTTFIIQIPIVE